MHSVRVLSQLLVSVLFIVTNTENSKVFFVLSSDALGCISIRDVEILFQPACTDYI